MTDDVIARLEQCEMELQAHHGYLKALECGLHAVIATTENPQDLRELWQHILADAPDHSAPKATEVYHAVFRGAMAKLTALIDQTAGRAGSEQG